MNQASETRTLRDYLRVLRRRRVLIIACVLVAAGAAAAYSLIKQPQYTATAAIGFPDRSTDLQALGVPVAPELQPEKLAAAGASVVTRDDVVASVRSALGTNLTARQIKGRISTLVSPDSNLVQISATDPSADFAARLANEFATQTQRVLTTEDRARFKSAAVSLQGRLGGLSPADAAGTVGQSYREGISRLLTLSAFSRPVQITRPAGVPSSPSSPKPVRDTLIAAFIGLIIGIVAAFLRQSLDRRLGESHEVQGLLGLPLIGYVREKAMGSGSLAEDGDGSLTAEDLDAFRILRANFEFLAKDREVRSVVVTSPLPQEGKSTVALWLAYTSAVGGRRTLLVECDFRRPVLAERLAVDPAPGLSEYLAGEAKPGEVLRSIAVRGRGEVDVLPFVVAGDNVFQPAEMLGSKRFKDFLGQVTKAYELVVLDGAPLLPVGDTRELLPEVGAALYCVRLGQTTRDQALTAMQALHHLPDLPVGLIVTGVQRGSEDDYYGYYTYAAKEPEPASASVS